MTITSISLFKVEIPMITSFTTSFGTVTRKPTVIVRIETKEGIVGYGESAALPFPMYKPETTDICMLVLKEYITPLILKREIKDPEALMEILSVIKGHNFAKTGIETAFWMAYSLKKKTSLTSLLHGTQKQIGVGESIGIHKTLDETYEEIRLRIDQGFQRIKLKIKPGWDVTLVESVRKKFADVDLMVDGNSAYTLEDIDTFKKLDGFNLTMIEQPLADDDIVDHAVLQKKLKTHICLDESITSAEDARRAISIGACKIINIKPGRVGGLLESKKIHDLCQKNDIGVWCGGMLETGIGRAFNIATASMPNYIYPSDMSPVTFYYKDDLVTESFTVDNNGYISVPSVPGIGFDIDEKKLKTYTIERISITK